jgi:hypothetical protein
MVAWFNKKTARALIQMAENLKAESLARAEAEEKLKAEIESKAAMERKVKAEAEKMLVAQFNKYNAMVEKAEAKAKEAIEKAMGQVSEAEEKVLVYEASLARSEERLNAAQKQLRAEVIARMQAEEMLKSESEERKRLEAQVEDMVAAAKAEAEEKVQSCEAELSKVKAKLIEAEEKLKLKALAEAKDDHTIKIKERRRLLEQPAGEVYTLGRKRGKVFHLGSIKKKFILLLVLVIFTALTFALSKTKSPAVAEPDGEMKEGTTPEQVTLAASDIDGDQLNSEIAKDASPGGMDAAAPGPANASSPDYERSENIKAKGNEEVSVGDLDTQLLTITAQPESLKITASAVGKNNIVQLSDDNRLETRIGSQIYFDFSDVTLGANAKIKSVILFVEHFEEERFAEGKLEWSIGRGWPGRPEVWAVMKAPVHHGESKEAVDAWDITSVLNAAEKINTVQLQIKNNNGGAFGKTLVDNAYMIVEYH